MFFLEITICLIIFTVVICIHEGIHYGMATILGYTPKVSVSKFLTPTVEFENKKRDIDNLLISSSAPLILFLVGCFISGENLVEMFLKNICLLNIVCLLPVSADGQVTMLSLINLIRREGNGENY